MERHHTWTNTYLPQLSHFAFSNTPNYLIKLLRGSIPFFTHNLQKKDNFERNLRSLRQSNFLLSSKLSLRALSRSSDVRILELNCSSIKQTTSSALVRLFSVCRALLTLRPHASLVCP